MTTITEPQEPSVDAEAPEAPEHLLELLEDEETPHEDLVESATDLVRKAKLYDELVLQERACAKLHTAWQVHKDTAAAAKREYEGATEKLRSLIRAQTEELPLFDGQPGPLEDESWREVTLESLGMTETTIEQLAEVEILTIGDLAGWSASGKRLVDIAGIGPAKAETIERFLDDFWAAHPGLGLEDVVGNDEAGDDEGGSA